MNEIFAGKGEVFIQRATVEGYEDATKTESSNPRLLLHPAIVEALLLWRQQSSFNADMLRMGPFSIFQGSNLVHQMSTPAAPFRTLL